MSGGFAAPDIAYASGAPTTLYVVPVRSPVMTLGYGSQWQASATGYIVAGYHAGGLPAAPFYRASPSAMAKVTISLRSGTTAGGYQDAWLGRIGCGVGLSSGLSGAAKSMTEYVTAGPWVVAADNYGYTGSWQARRHFKAGLSYSVIFGRAVWGPSGTHAPQADGGRILFDPSGQFSDPAFPKGSECCDTSKLTLSLRGHVIRPQVYGEWRAPQAGWYTMTIKSRRRTPGLVVPDSLLSRTETLIWRFYADPSSVPVGYQRELPARVVRTTARGLNLNNQAAPGGTTTLLVRVVQAHANGYIRAHRYRVKSVRMLVSFDGGRTWQNLRLIRRGSHWLATVHDPASGFAALRSIVTDSRGDRYEQTIYQAYAIG
jgi:hypothetical protein